MSIADFRSRARQALAAGTALTMLALAATPPAQADWFATTSGWFKDRIADGTDFFGSLAGGTMSFGYAVAKAGCNAGPYDGKDLTSILAISFLYAEAATDAYVRGLSYAEQAVGIRNEQGRVVFESIADLVARANYGNNFRNFSEVDHTIDRNEPILAEVKRKAAEGFSDAAEQDLTRAIASLYTANELQAQAVVGLLLVAGYVKLAHEHGRSDAVSSLLSRELSSNGADESVRTLSQSPQAVLRLVGNFGEAYSLTSSLEKAVDFDVEEEELRKLGVEEDLAAVSAVAEQRARAAAKPEAQALPFRPGGDTIRVMLNSSGLVDERVGGVAVAVLSMACSGVFSQPALNAEPTPGTPAPQPSFGPDEIVETQQALIDLGYLKDVADGAWGPKSRAAMQAFVQQEGLANTSGEPSFAGLEALHRAKGKPVRPSASGAAPQAPASKVGADDQLPTAKEVLDGIGKDAGDAISQISNTFFGLLGGGSKN